MLQKRPLEEEAHDVSAKQPRHLEPKDERVPTLEFPAYDTSKTECNGSPDGGYRSLVQAFSENEVVTPPMIASTKSEEDIPCSAMPCPDHCDSELPTTTIIHSREIYSYLFENPPQKLVPIGKDFQAELPECVGQGETISSSSSESMKSDSGYRPIGGDKFTGSCIIPMPESPMSLDAGNWVGAGRICCSCDDMGSIRCVQQHVDEARIELSKTLGEEAFSQLGFCDMGEVVAEKWSNHEEDIFREVVFRNAAFRRDFWDELASEFPFRTKKEIVSYYFNVFMLRKRAEQNRIDVLEIDSDNDAWEGDHGSADDVTHKRDASDDSGDETPEHQDDFGCGESYETNWYKSNNEVFTLKTSEDEVHGNLDRDKCIASRSETCFSHAVENGSSGIVYQPLDHDVHDDLRKHYVLKVRCQSDSSGSVLDVDIGKDHEVRHWNSNLTGLSGSNGHEFLMEHCSSKDWEVGYFPCSKSEDFLPTCSVIEEVFGSGVCNYKT